METNNSQNGEPLFNRIDQVGVVVKDVDERVRNYETIFGEGAFVIVEGEGQATLADGRGIMIKGKLAFVQLGPVQVELIEIKDGPSIHVDFLKTHGEGIHHVAKYVEDFDKELQKFRERGIRVLQQGSGMRRYAYLDTKPFILELIEGQPMNK
ncbi:VOC family protein [Candidatus Poribacteria bacterium]|nr:VOC family protein [Candidatus Poribacteria bacterium]